MWGQVRGERTKQLQKKVARKRIFIQGKSNQSIFMKSDLILSAFKLPAKSRRMSSPSRPTIFSLVMIQHEIFGWLKKGEKQHSSAATKKISKMKRCRRQSEWNWRCERPERNFGRTSLESCWILVGVGWLYPSDLANCMTTEGGWESPTWP